MMDGDETTDADRRVAVKAGADEDTVAGERTEEQKVRKNQNPQYRMKLMAVGDMHQSDSDVPLGHHVWYTSQNSNHTG